MTPGVAACSTVSLPDCGVVERPRDVTGRESPGASRPPGSSGGPDGRQPAPVSRFACLGVERWNRRFGKPAGPTSREAR
jgi:hypothetical protein